LAKKKKVRTRARSKRKPLLVYLVASGFIGLFYICVVSVAICLISATQMRSTSGATFDTWRLNYKSADAASKKYGDDRAALQGKASTAQDQLNFTIQCLAFYDDNGLLKPSIDKELIEEARAAKKQRLKYEDQDQNVKCIWRGYGMLKYDQSYFKTEADNYPLQIKELDLVIKENHDDIAELLKGHSDFLAFLQLEKEWWARFFVSTPYDVLILLLVVSMGALGGIVRLLRDYGDQKERDPTSKDYLLIPLIGATVAIGGFVLAKTGLLLLSSTKEEASLSPFMIGLVGLISGLLAREVIDKIAGSGRNILAGKSVTARKPSNKKS
jgi:hypothetical protein